MKAPEHYDHWREARRREPAPAGLAARIMAELEARQVQPGAQRRELWVSWPAQRRTAILAVAASIFALRVAAAFAVFIPS
jgi:hypothetical protein